MQEATLRLTLPMDDAVPATTTPDADLVAAVLGGDRGAFDDLVRRYDRCARGTCYSVLRDWHLARDAAQDGFVTAYTNLRLLRRPAAFGPWLLTIMRHRATRVARGGRKFAPLHLVPEPAAKDPADDVEALIAALAGLPEHERCIVMLRYFDGESVSTISLMSGLPLTTVKKRLSRAHERLRKVLAQGDPS